MNTQKGNTPSKAFSFTAPSTWFGQEPSGTAKFPNPIGGKKAASQPRDGFKKPNTSNKKFKALRRLQRSKSAAHRNPGKKS